MAVENAKSQIVTDLDALPVVKVNQLERGAATRSAIATLALTATEAGGDATSVWRMLRIPARARIERVEIANDALDDVADLAVDIGLYEIGGGAVKDADFFASAVTELQTANLVFTDVTYESAVVDIPDMVKALWEQLGDADTPENRGKEYDVALTVTTAAATGAAGDITMRVTYALFE